MNKLSYETARALKEAGFPQYPEPDGLPGKAIFISGTYVLDNGGFYIPTLEELIDACGDDCSFLENKSSEWLALSRAARGKTTGGAGTGKTPSEAVANLYLALNKK